MSLQPLLAAPPVIQVHAFAAIAAFVIGAIVLFNKKGDARHMFLGRLWVILMVIVAVSSFFIWTIRLMGPFSPIHLLSIFTLWGLWSAVGEARAKKIVQHRRSMQQIYLGALIIAGFFTFMPGRIMYHVLFGTSGAGPVEWATFLTGFTLIIGGGALVLRKRLGWRLPRLKSARQ